MVQATSVYVSSLTMAFIAIDRHRALTKPFAIKIGEKVNQRLLAVLIWVVAIMLALPLSLFNEVVEVFTFRPMTRCQVAYPAGFEQSLSIAVSVYTLITQCLLPLITASVAYSHVAYRIYHRKLLTSATNTYATHAFQQSKMRTLTMMLVCCVSFGACWMPLNIYYLLVDLNLIKPSYLKLVTFHVIAMSSACYNPFIYCWFNAKFRVLLRDKLCCCVTSSGHHNSTRSFTTKLSTKSDSSSPNQTHTA